MTVDATSLENGLTIDASGNDPTPDDDDNGDGSRVFNIDDRNSETNIAVTIGGLTLTGGDVHEYGGSIFSLGDVTVTNSTISENFAEGGGGGIWSSANVTMISSTISGNSQSGDGGGVSARGAVIVTSSTISGNSANHGGGIHARGAVTVTSSTISGNSSDDDGAGIYGNGEVKVTSSTISENLTSYDGGGIYAGGAATITIDHSIVAGNTTRDSAPDVHPGTGPFTVRNSLIGDNTNTGLDEAPVGTPDANGNLIGGPTDGIIDPLLAPLADNGGPTWTHALLLGSPAIDAGDPSFTPPPDFDQRGDPFARVFGGRIDMGAYERQTGDMDFDGDIDFDDIVALVLGLTDLDVYEVLYGAPPNANGDTDGDGDLDFDDIAGFADLLSSGLAARTLSTGTGALSMIAIANDHAENDPADGKPSTESRREVASGEDLVRPRLLTLDPFVKKRTRAPRPWSTMATKPRDRQLRDNELATVWSDRFDWLKQTRGPVV